MSTGDIKILGIACLNFYNVDMSGLTFQLFQNHQLGEATSDNPSILEFEFEGNTIYYKIDGHYAQSINLKCSIDKKTWTTIFSDTDH